METWVRGQCYDLDAIAKIHPGGEVVLSAAGIDSTSLFESHHAFSDTQRVETMLRRFLKKDPSSLSPSEGCCGKYTKASALHDELTKRVRPEVLRIRGRLDTFYKIECVGLISLVFVMEYCYLLLGAWWAALLMPWIEIHYAMMVMHPVHHGTLWDNNGSFQKVAHALSLILSAGGTRRWIFSHLRHHVFPADEEKDPDIHPGAGLRYDSLLPRQAYHAWQWVYGWFLYMLTGISFSVEGASLEPSHTHTGDTSTMTIPGPTSKGGHYLLKAIGFIIRFVIPLCLVPWRVIAIKEFSGLLSSLWLTCVFQVNHFTTATHETLRTHKARHASSELKHGDWAECQIAASNDFSTKSTLLTHLTGGLNMQIEHHLYPTVSHWILPTIHRHLVALLKERAIKMTNYDNIFTALRDHNAFLVRMGEGDSNLKA